MSPRTSDQFKEIRKQSKTKILLAALELFAIDGYHNTSISKIAKHAAVSKGLMYNYFDGKEDLLQEVVILSIQDVNEASIPLQQKMSNSTPSEILKAFILLFFDMLEQNAEMWKLTMSLALQINNIPSVTKLVHTIFEEVLKKIENVLQLNGFSDFQVKARLLSAQLDGIAIHYIIFKDTYKLEEVKNKLIEEYSKY